MTDGAPMQFLNQPIEFEALAGNAVPTWAARVDDSELLAFCQAAQ